MCTYVYVRMYAHTHVRTYVRRYMYVRTDICKVTNDRLQLVGIRPQPRRDEPQTPAASGQSSTYSATPNPVHPDVGNECHTPTASDIGNSYSASEVQMEIACHTPTAPDIDNSLSDNEVHADDDNSEIPGSEVHPDDSATLRRDRLLDHEEFMQFCDRDNRNDPVLDRNGRVVDGGDTNNPNRPTSELQTRWSDVWHARDTGTDMDVVRNADEQTAKLATYMEKCVTERRRYEEEARHLTVMRDEAQQKRSSDRLLNMMDNFIASIGDMAAAWDNQAHFTTKYQALHSNLLRMRKCRIVANEDSMKCNTWIAHPDLPPPADHDEAATRSAKALWKDGVMSTNSGNFARILLPLRHVADFFRVAKIDVYTRTGYIQVDLDLLQETTVYTDEIRWLRTVKPEKKEHADSMQETSHVDRTNLTSLHVLFGRPTPSKKPLKTEKIPNHIEFHTIEFSWNYDQYMSRFHLQTPTRGDATRHERFLDAVLHTLRLTKQCQYMRQVRVPTDYPFNDLEDMPVVVWMKRAVLRGAQAQESAHGDAMDGAAGSADHGWSKRYTNRDRPTGSADHRWDHGWDQQRGDAQRQIGYTNRDWHTRSADHGWDHGREQQRGDAEWQTGYNNRDTRNPTWHWR